MSYHEPDGLWSCWNIYLHKTGRILQLKLATIQTSERYQYLKRLIYNIGVEPVTPVRGPATLTLVNVAKDIVKKMAHPRWLPNGNKLQLLQKKKRKNRKKNMTKRLGIKWIITTAVVNRRLIFRWLLLLNLDDFSVKTFNGIITHRFRAVAANEGRIQAVGMHVLCRRSCSERKKRCYKCLLLARFHLLTYAFLNQGTIEKILKIMKRKLALYYAFGGINVFYHEQQSNTTNAFGLVVE